MHETAANFESESSQRPALRLRLQPDGTVDVWKWIAASLLAVVLLLAGYLSRPGISRAEAEQIVTGPANPYVADRAALQLDQKNIKDQLRKMQLDIDEMKAQLVHISIAVGVDPGNGDSIRRRHKE
ncbi:MAG: hypothetical protein CXZ00_02970 [Acidobacteria bacterium]|nr:MAG: hypothetical protein CXZ00_02970 [Acidobacteriota bacterium]